MELNAPSKSRVDINDWYGVFVVLKSTLPLVASMTFIGSFYSRSISWVIICVCLLGWSGYRMQFLLHDASHHTLFRSRRANEVVGRIGGTMVGVDYDRYRFTHMWHHRKNGEESDPQFPDYLGMGAITKSGFIRFVIEPLYGARLFPYLKRELGNRTLNGYEAPKSSPLWWSQFVSTQALILLLLSSNLSNPETILFFYVGLATVSLFLARIRALAEHQQLGQEETDYSRSHRFNLFEWFVLYDANFNFHAEHHLYPNTQSRKLKSLAIELRKNGTIKDPLSNSMVGTLKILYEKLPSRL